ncbi:hypothetical protein B296_00024703 [Ensete ventricosum]|uniref:Uncharacterized protein n=1 Tax=Ensete ventricosum TaxID=4639 RepID=A0A426ZTS9_ENSVE|nr:hypothetical protein B296_00024703 [Ensete ventricosum]
MQTTERFWLYAPAMASSTLSQLTAKITTQAPTPRAPPTWRWLARRERRAAHDAVGRGVVHRRRFPLCGIVERRRPLEHEVFGGSGEADDPGDDSATKPAPVASTRLNIEDISEAVRSRTPERRGRALSSREQERAK